MFEQLHKVLEVLEECQQRAAHIRVSVADFDDKLELLRYTRLAVQEFGKLVPMLMQEKQHVKE